MPRNGTRACDSAGAPCILLRNDSDIVRRNFSERIQPYRHEENAVAHFSVDCPVAQLLAPNLPTRFDSILYLPVPFLMNILETTSITSLSLEADNVLPLVWRSFLLDNAAYSYRHRLSHARHSIRGVTDICFQTFPISKRCVAGTLFYHYPPF